MTYLYNNTIDIEIKVLLKNRTRFGGFIFYEQEFIFENIMLVYDISALKGEQLKPDSMCLAISQAT